MNKNEYDIDYTLNDNFEEKGKSTIAGFGLTPLGGVQFRIGNMFSIATEGRFRWGIYTFKSNFSGSRPSFDGAYSGENSGKSVETKFSPIGLVVFNIHL